ADRGGRERAEQRPGRRRHRPRVAVDQVDVGERDRAADRGGGIFAELAALRAAGDRDAVIIAGDGDGHGFAGGGALAVGDRDRIALGQRLAVGEILDGRIVDREAPVDLAGAVAGRVIADERAERAEITAAGGRHGDAVGVATVDIAEREAAVGAGRQRILGDIALDRAGADGDAVVGAGDGYGDRLGRTLAVPVIDDDRVGLGRALA